ncbi:MAG: hypothetical protein ACRDZU_02555 [Acidimicrobiales bacterium]
MYLFTRAGRLAPGAFREGAAFVAAITEKVNQDTGLDVHTWAASMSPELGTVVWANFVESLEELEAAQDKLNVSDQFIELAEKGSKLFAGPMTDRLASVVVGARDPSAPLPSYVTVARAVAANGHISDAMAAGVEIAETATRITGIQTMFLADATGDFGGCRWNSGYADIGSMERAEAALMADESWLKLIDRIGPAFQQGANQSIYRRLI